MLSSKYPRQGKNEAQNARRASRLVLISKRGSHRVSRERPAGRVSYVAYLDGEGTLATFNLNQRHCIKRKLFSKLKHIPGSRERNLRNAPLLLFVLKTTQTNSTSNYFKPCTGVHDSTTAFLDCARCMHDTNNVDTTWSDTTRLSKTQHRRPKSGGLAGGSDIEKPKQDNDHTITRCTSSSDGPYRKTYM